MKPRWLEWTGLQKFAAVLPPALAVGAMLLVFLGSSLDHHFAERQFGHGHVFLSFDSLWHVHFCEGSQGHSRDPVDGGNLHLLSNNGAESSGPGVPGSGAIVYLTLNDGTGTAFSGLSGPLTGQEYGLNELGNASMLGTFSDEAVRIGAIVPPPKKPPRI